MFKLIEINGKSNQLLKRLFSNKIFEIKGNNNKLIYLSKCELSSETPEKSGQDYNYDIIINGGGIVGFSTFMAFKSSPFLRDKKICLIERQNKPNELSFERKDNQFSNRVSSITTASKDFFQSIGIWNDFKDNAKPIKEFYVWSQNYKNSINFRTNYFSNDIIGEDNEVVCYIIENNRILSSLQSNVNRFADEVKYGTIVTDIKSNTNCVELHTKCLKTEDSGVLRTRLLVGCDGFQSIVRQKSNLKNFEHDLEQMAIVGTIAVDAGEGNLSNDISFQRFVPFDNSVIALLPLNQEFCSFVLSVPKNSAKHLMEMSDNQFVDHMNDILYVESDSSDTITSKLDHLIDGLIPKNLFGVQSNSYSVPHVLSITPDSRAVFPLKFGTTLPYLVGAPNDSKDNNRIAIIGDAAHRVHPLAGQGLNLGIGDANALFESIEKPLSRGQTLFGEYTEDSKQLENCLFEFERNRQIRVIPMLSAIHSMQQLFTCVPTQFLTIFNSSEFLKQRIISFANKN